MPETESHRNEARERLSEQVLSANTLLEIEEAKAALRQWMQLHSEEQGMRDGFEQLYTIQEIIEAEEASSPNRSLNSAQAA